MIGFIGTRMPKGASGEKINKLGQGFALFLSGKMGLASLGWGCLKMGMGKEMNKMGLGFALFLSGKMGLASLGLGCLKVGMGMEINRI